ncbi:DNA-binding IclR family transcriptional regulator [Mycobacterium sp. OAS707]|uniref:IclR family transcriptional regulator n=1 Tax=unclassified Mycobacterium TaxID=2642494 RepID=UPI0017890C0D|nr:DNA-binding IclR family transcriptional regulator [Mycobacterium sp. OAS707]
MAGEVVSDDRTMVGRAFAVIEAVAAHGPPVSLAELAYITGIPKPTTHRIVNNLVARELLKRTDRGYALGPALSRLGETASLQRDFERYIPVLEDLHAAYGGAAWLTAGREVDKVQPVVMVCDKGLVAAARALWPAPGTSAMLANTAGGHLALAQRPELFEQVARRGMAPSTPNSLREVSELSATVDRVRRDGFAVESEQSTRGWSCAAALLPSTTDTLAVIGVTLQVGRANSREVLRALLRAFNAIAADDGPLSRQGVRRPFQ